MHVINVHYACDTPVTRSAGPCDCPDLSREIPGCPTGAYRSVQHSPLLSAAQDARKHIMVHDAAVGAGLSHRTEVQAFP